MRVGDVGVDLGGGDVAVAKHLLNAAQIRPIHQQISGKTVTQGMWADVFGDAG